MEGPPGQTRQQQAPGRVKATEATLSSGWEYQDYVLKYQPGSSYKLGFGYTEANARLAVWQDTQKTILTELQTWLDAGWEPVSEVGPGGVALRSYKSRTKGLGFVGLFFVLCTGGLMLLFPDWWTEPQEFRVNMRRHR